MTTDFKIFIVPYDYWIAEWIEFSKFDSVICITYVFDNVIISNSAAVLKDVYQTS